jgi:hypothetical protein
MKLFNTHSIGATALCVLAAAFSSIAMAQTKSAGNYFNRIATFEAHRNVPAGRNVSKKSVAEIVAASADGMTLAYTDGEQMGIGLIDIRNPALPKPAGFIALDGEATSVVITRGKVLAVVDTSKDFVQPSGQLAVFDLASKKLLASCPLFGQPDSITLDKDARHAVIVIENQRDEKLNKGTMPQAPSGNLTIIPLSKQGLPDCTRSHPIALSGLAEIAPSDAEPELVKVNSKGLAVITLQENNHIVLVDVAKRQVVKHFSAGTVDLKDVDLKRDGIINPSESIKGVLREPDAVAWLDDKRFVTANEGDYKGGSRSFSIFNTDGKVEWDSGNFLDHEAIRLGHYPEARSGSKGNEPEGIFVGSERSSLVTVWRDRGANLAPEYLQALPAGSGPEGLLAIAQRGLLVVANENDGASRSSVMIYQRGAAVPAYPTLMSNDTSAGPPIAWGAISGATANRKQAGRLFAVTDSFYATTRIIDIDTKFTPALITGALTVSKDGKPVGYDAEGIIERADGGFWLASEGDPDKKPAPLANLLVRLNAKAEVQEEIALPAELAQHATRFGFEGVTVTGTGDQEVVWLAVQREWKNDPKGMAKILRYTPATKVWGVYHYPLESSKAEGGWVGLSEITAIAPDRFVVVERDNQFGDQAIKTLQVISVAGIAPASPGDAKVPVLQKRLLRNLVPDLQKPNGYVLDKVESFAMDSEGRAFIITDNDGVDGSTSGETQFIRLGKLLGLQ